MFTAPYSSVGSGKVVAGVPTPALLPFDRAERRRPPHGEHRLEVEREVPSGVELAVPLDGEVFRPLVVLVELDARLVELGLGPDDADECLHRLLELVVERVRVLPAFVVEV